MMIERWLSDYRRAWSIDDPDAVTALFTEDARYFTAPYSSPLVGSGEIAQWWIAQGESRMRWEAEHHVVACSGDLYVVRGTTTYPDSLGPSGKPEVYHNLWLVTLTEDGRAREFVEYWMLET